MCRNIRRLYNFDPPVTETEVRAAALQFVRKISGSAKPSAANEMAFNRAVDAIAGSASELLDSLVSRGLPKKRDIDGQKVHARTLRKSGP